ncbi:MAG: biosynthetic arginine decarboxylase [Ignavibacteria bacterium]|nr:biosynthetic arginine decarboxylase [Ignavibacteria bacterium]
MRKWRIEDSIELYNINGWGQDYFSVNEKGNLVVTPSKNGVKIDMKELVDELILRDVSLPVLIRFPDILDDRIETITRCFEDASKEYDFKGKYYNVYPIKVNQVRPVVEELMRYGQKYNIGLEAGSKPELHVVLAVAHSPESLIICNGYKDENFIELALLAQKMGRKIFVVVEKLNELKLLISTAKRLKIKPNIGIRIKLATQGSGKWEDTTGDKSKFGLSSSEVIEAIEIIKSAKLLDSFKLIHFHIGSQVANIRTIKNALRECSQFYVQMRKLGCNIEYVDIGGGLGVDYDGTRSFSPSSINYTINEYVYDAVYMLKEACTKNNLPHPNIITESGRSLTAHHSVLIFNVLESNSIPRWNYEEDKIEEDDHDNVKELYNLLENINASNLLENWHDAQQLREDSLDLFSLGLLDLKSRAKVEKLFWSIATDVYNIASEMKHMPEEIRPLSRMLADKYFCNFSLFQSLPDSWAIDQIFPIVPIHRLNEKPTRFATLHDITCDSDGKIDTFIGMKNYSHYLPVHELKSNEPYYIGVFLVGAYQEILGDLHNLFGDTNAVHVVVEDDSYKIVQIIYGETVADVLDFVQYDAKRLVRTIETWVTAAVKEGKITPQEGKEFLSNYRSGLYGYTYLE